MPPRTRSRIAAATLVALAVIYAQQFLSVHELGHLFEADASQCVYAPLASVGGGAVLPAPPALPAPPPRAVQQTAPAAPPGAALIPPPQARGPPAA